MIYAIKEHSVTKRLIDPNPLIGRISNLTAADDVTPREILTVNTNVLFCFDYPCY